MGRPLKGSMFYLLPVVDLKKDGSAEVSPSIAALNKLRCEAAAVSHEEIEDGTRKCGHTYGIPPRKLDFSSLVG